MNESLFGRIRKGLMGFPSKYNGSYSHRQVLKTVLPKLHGKKVLSKEEKKFLDSVNDFITKHGISPIDQSGYPPFPGTYSYIKMPSFKSGGGKTKNKFHNQGNNTKNTPISKMYASFNRTLKLKNSVDSFKGGGTYILTVFSVDSVGGNTIIKAKNNFLKDKEYLIFEYPGSPRFDTYIDVNVKQYDAFRNDEHELGIVPISFKKR